MSRKKDPIFLVMDYFECQPLAVVQSTLSLVKRLVQVRSETATDLLATRPRRAQRPAAGQPAQIKAPIVPPPSRVPPTRMIAQPPRRRQRATIPGPTGAATPEADVALPGLGPSTVGD